MSKERGESRIYSLEQLFKQTQDMIKDKAVEDRQNSERIHSEISTLSESVTALVQDSRNHRDKLEKTLKDFTHAHYVSKIELNTSISKKIADNNKSQMNILTLIITILIAISMAITYVVDNETTISKSPTRVPIPLLQSPSITAP